MKSSSAIRSGIVWLLAFVFFFSSHLIQAQSTAKETDFAAQAASVTEFEVNGLKVLLKKRSGSPTVAVGLFIRGGSRNIDQKTAGIERLMLNSAIEAGKNLPRAAVRRQLASIGANLGVETSEDFSNVNLACTRADFEKAFNIYSTLLISPEFNPSDIARVKEQILTALRETEAVPEGALDAMEEKIIYQGHPYSNRVDGTVSTIQSFSPADIKNYHKKIMQTSQLLLVIVGDFDRKDIEPLIANTFGKLPRGNYSPKPLPRLDFSQATLDVSPKSLPTNYVRGVFAAPTLSDKDYYAMRVAIAILQSLVYQEVRGRLQLSYAPDADIDNLESNTANISVSTTDPNTATAAMLAQIKLLQNRTLDPRIIDEIASFFLTRYYMGQETSLAQVGELAKYELVAGSWRRSFDFIDGVRNVTPSDIRMVANKYMKNIRFLYVGDPEAVNKMTYLNQ
ncbi:MAG TPA: pitrilysin family protein [Pyrinomonadaceae bacterium]|jgi:predicted Zn-dependent peptidase|nr:pitrilysin family protein [Pyrinomonadaceae bacterium]